MSDQYLCPSGLPESYINPALGELQVAHGISHLRTLTPVLAEILRTAQNARVVLIGADYLLDRMAHAFLDTKSSSFPVNLTAAYLDGRARGRWAALDDAAISAEMAQIDASKFAADSQDVREWLVALTQVEEILKRLKSQVGSILDSSKINILEFCGRYGDKTAERMIQFARNHAIDDDPLRLRSDALILVSELAWTSTAISDLPARGKVILAMTIVSLSRNHKADIAESDMAGHSWFRFIENIRGKRIKWYMAAMADHSIDPESLFPDTGISALQAWRLLRIILEEASTPTNHRQRYQSVKQNMRSFVLRGHDFGDTVDSRADMAKRCLEGFTFERYRHILGFFGFRVAPAES